jgi:uncharacterized membrane protein
MRAAAAVHVLIAIFPFFKTKMQLFVFVHVLVLKKWIFQNQNATE